MKKLFFSVLMVFFFVWIAATAPMSAASDVESVNMLEEKNIEQKFKELSDHWQRQFVEAVNDFLEKELKNFKDNKDKKKTPQENLSHQIEKFEKELKRDPENPETYFSLGRLYDEKGEGASAIVNLKKAEEIFLERKDVKGVAEARRSLRRYFNKYDYKPEDFELDK